MNKQRTGHRLYLGSVGFYRRSHRRYCHALMLFLFTLVSILQPVLVFGQDRLADSYPDHVVKANCIHRFLLFTEWPSSAFVDQNAPIRVGFLGNSVIYADLIKIVNGKTVQDRRIEVVFFSTVETMTDCHVLFIDSSEQKNLNQIHDKIKGKPVLTLGDTDGWIEQHLIINMLIRDSKVTFEINLDKARENSLILSSKLFRLASRIIDSESSERQ